jgi:hypothetical protein
MTSIEVDFDVYKVLTMKRETESVTYNAGAGVFSNSRREMTRGNRDVLLRPTTSLFRDVRLECLDPIRQ